MTTRQNEDLENKTTVDTILDYLKKSVENNEIISPTTWLRAAMKLNMLLQDESSKLYVAEQECAKMRAELIGQGKTVASAKITIEASNEYRYAREQKAKIDRVVEAIRLSKVQARVANDEIKGY